MRRNVKDSIGTILAFTGGIILAPFASLYTQSQSVSPELTAISPFIEVHGHLEPKDATGSIEAALRAMRAENTAKMILFPTPSTSGDPSHFDEEVAIEAVKIHPDKFAFLGGQEVLNRLVQEAFHSNSVGPEIQERFKKSAEETIRRGSSGFGEMTAEQFATSPSSHHEYAPADHPLFLLLADISAEHGGMPIVFHMEAAPESIPLPIEMKSPPNPPQIHESISAFENLLTHNPHARILWAHEGWDNTGYRTVDLSRRLLLAHPNLYMEIKIDPVEVGKNSPLSDGRSGAIKAEWLKLFQDFPDRFVIGTDQHYPEPGRGPQRWEPAVLLLNQLPADLRQKIGIDNPIRIYHLN